MHTETEFIHFFKKNIRRRGEEGGELKKSSQLLLQNVETYQPAPQLPQVSAYIYYSYETHYMRVWMGFID